VRLSLRVTDAALSRTIRTMPERPAVRQTLSPAESWFGSAAMRTMLALEQRQAAPDIDAVYGQCGLFLLAGAAAPGAPSARRLHRQLCLHRQADALAGDLRCRDQALPVASGAITLAYVQHVLETSVDADALVGELARVLAPEGIAAFIAFHPYRPLRLRWWVRGLRAIPALRLSAMVVEHGLEVRSVRPLGAVWQARAGSEDGAAAPWLAGSYLLLARKRVHGLTPLRASGQRVALNAGMGAG